MSQMANPQWWYALAAWIKDRAESMIGFCLWVAEEIENHREGR